MIAIMSGSVLTIGKFDSVHRGHQAILAQGRKQADRYRCPLIAMSFDPDPTATLQPQALPPRITSLSDKIDHLRQSGVDEVVVLEPTMELLMQSPGQFIRQIAETYHPHVIVEGRDFRFGKGRQGDLQTLNELSSEYGFLVSCCEKMQVSLSDLTVSPVSTSLIRWLIGRGRVHDASICMGRLFRLSGKIVAGDRLGRRIGMPTANLSPEAYFDYIVPSDGVYAGLAELDDGTQYTAAISVGIKPTFENKRLTVEAHLLDFDGDLYGRSISFSFARWIRDQYVFPDIESLSVQLKRDIEQTIKCRDMGLLDAASPQYEEQGASEVCV